MTIVPTKKLKLEEGEEEEECLEEGGEARLVVETGISPPTSPEDRLAAVTLLPDTEEAEDTAEGGQSPGLRVKSPQVGLLTFDLRGRGHNNLIN